MSIYLSPNEELRNNFNEDIKITKGRIGAKQSITLLVTITSKSALYRAKHISRIPFNITKQTFKITQASTRKT
ncbi:hypothetical protein RB213_002130 [Colletotrichum asianum]